MLMLDVRGPLRPAKEAGEVAHRRTTWNDGTGHGRELHPVRARLIAATVDLVSVVGAHDLRVTHLCASAGVSRRAFYNYFADVWDVIHAAYLEIDGEFRRLVQTACDLTPPGDACAMSVVHGVVSFVEQDPVRADALFVQGFAAGPEVAEARIDTVEWLVGVLREHGVPTASGPAQAQPAAVGPGDGVTSDTVLEIAVGGVLSVIAEHVHRGEIPALRGHAAELAATLTRVATGYQRPLG